ncbi:MAG: hypothetical protein ACQETJ_12500 [Bacteroidota bacterium]
MKQKFRIITVLFLAGFLTAGITALAEEKTKEYNESWPARSVETLKIDNKFGEVKVTNQGGNDVTIDVVVTVEAPNESRADELLEQINVVFSKSGNTVSAETRIDNDFKSRRDFSIDYLVNIPTDKNLDISNKYGNTMVNVLNANGTFDIQYGNFTANELNSPAIGTMDIMLAYGKADISLSNDLDVEVKYSTMNLGETDDLLLNSKYTVINLEKASTVETESKYDTFNFEEIGSFSGETKYTHIKIDELLQRLNIEAGYGGIRVNRVAKNFDSISITNSYGQVSLGLGDATYSVDATCEYCGISYPEDDFTGNRMNENQTRTIEGKVGTGSGGTVVVKSRYGQIKLN